MDEKTKHIVASNLTLAYLSKNQKRGKEGENVPIFDFYQKFLGMLDNDENLAIRLQKRREDVEKKLA